MPVVLGLELEPDAEPEPEVPLPPSMIVMYCPKGCSVGGKERAEWSCSLSLVKSRGDARRREWRLLRSRDHQIKEVEVWDLLPETNPPHVRCRPQKKACVLLVK